MANTQSLAATKTWFENTIVPQRAASAGFSLNRLWKSPLALFRGNTEDPDGLCGDAAAYVYERFFTDFGDYITTDGFQIGLVLWNGRISNHIANVMLAKKKTAPETYKWDSKRRVAVSTAGVAQYTSSQLLKLYVYDLYYKKASTVELWWKDLDGAMGGSVKIALLHNIDD